MVAGDVLRKVAEVDENVGLAPQLVGNPQAFDGPQPRDPRRPEGVYRSARGRPIQRDVALDLPCDHCSILALLAYRRALGEGTWVPYDEYTDRPA